MKKVFIDGASGTTGLKILALLDPLVVSGAIEIVRIADRRDEAQRLDAYTKADVSIMCLHDDIAADTARKLEGAGVRVIDVSSAHRVSGGWVYGFPELDRGHGAVIAKARLVTNPGCFATGAVAVLRPLVLAGLLSADTRVTIVGASGYTGGGKTMIEAYEAGDADFKTARAIEAYSLSAPHKHIPEIARYAGLSVSPVFMPHVLPVPRGIIVSIPLAGDAIRGDRQAVQAVYESAYQFAGSSVCVEPLDAGFSRLNLGRFTALNSAKASDADADGQVYIRVSGWQQPDGSRQITVHAELDNLGKGAASQAVQNLKLMLGL